MYNKILKNNQVTYGRPYHVKLPDNLLQFADADENEQDETDEMLSNASPEELLKRAEKSLRPLYPERKQRQSG